MSTPIVTTTDTIRSAAAHRVYVSEFWTGGTWVEVPHLYCRTYTKSGNPTIPTATLEWRYGIGMRPGEQSYAVVPKKSLENWLVKIEIDQPNDANGNPTDPDRWYGIIPEEGDNPEGAFPAGGATRIPSGRQAFMAYGLEWLLEREIITTAWYTDGLTQFTELRVGHGLCFNREYKRAAAGGIDHKKHRQEVGNCSTGVGPNGVPIFLDDPSGGVVWTPLDIVEYLLAYHSPHTIFGDVVLPIKLDDASRALFPIWGIPILETHGRSVKQVLDELLDRRKLVGYTLDVTEETMGVPGRVTLRAFSYTDVPIFLSDIHSIEANPDLKSLDFDAALDIEVCHVKTSAAQVVDQVIAEGARIVVCGTVSALDLNLVGNWTAAQKTEYNAGASGAADWAALSRNEKEQRNNDYRKTDRLYRVYAYFGVPTTWNRMVRDGEEGPTETSLFPYDLLNADAAEYGQAELDPGVDSAWYAPDVPFLPTLPLKADHDYTGTKIADDSVADATPAGQAWEYRPIYVLMKFPETGMNNRYGEIDKLAINANVELLSAGAGREFSCSVKTQEQWPGIILRVSGHPQHTLAKTDFVPPDATLEEMPDWDWQDNLLVTFAMETQRHVEAGYPPRIEAAADAGDKPARVLRIDASQKYALHYVAPNTVVDLIDGALQRTTSGGFIRDDRDMLKEIARVAYEWYGETRRALTLVYRQATALCRVGDLITQIGAAETLEAIRTIITEITVDLAEGPGQVDRTTVHTQWAELDVMRLL
jgi:hypothetical protein